MMTNIQGNFIEKSENYSGKFPTLILYSDETSYNF